MNMVTDLFYECKLLLSRLVVLGCTRIDHFSGLKFYKGNSLPRTDFDLSCGKSVVVLLRFSDNSWYFEVTVSSPYTAWE